MVVIPWTVPFCLAASVDCSVPLCLMTPLLGHPPLLGNTCVSSVHIPTSCSSPCPQPVIQ